MHKTILTMSKVVIGGGTGFIGTALSNLLKRKGHAVTIVSRKKNRPDVISWEDIKEQGLPSGTDAVVNLSGAPLINPMRRWNEAYKQEIRDSRLKTNQLFKEAIISATNKPQVWASVSGVGYYPTSLNEKYDEDSPGGSDQYLPQLAKDWEEEAKLPNDSVGVRQVIVRSGAILGRNGGLIQNLWMPFNMGLGCAYGDGKQWLPWIHVDDIAGLFAHIIENDNASGILNAVAPKPSTNEEFTKVFAKEMKRPLIIFNTPEFVIKFMLGDERAPLLLEGQHVTPKRTLESGYTFLYPNLNVALQNIIAS